MNRKQIKALLITIGVLIIILVPTILYIQNQRLKEELSYTTINMNAYDVENSHLKNRILVYQFTVAQLNYLKDSILVEMNNVRKELNIKDDNIRRLEYIASTASRTDTIYIREIDTIFREPDFHIDTLKEDEWYSLHLEMSYPNKVTVTPSFKSEKYIITHSRRETIKSPKKCAIGRWFQKKHNVLEVEIVEKNPYIINDKQKFVEIIK
jgi:hypothetical protein